MYYFYGIQTIKLFEGEVYEVDEKMLLKLDELEDHPNFYIREIYTVKLYKNECVPFYISIIFCKWQVLYYIILCIFQWD